MLISNIYSYIGFSVVELDTAELYKTLHKISEIDFFI